MLEKQFSKDGSKIFQIWPLITNLGISAENNSLLQQNIDLVYVFGGDGTLLNLLRELYVYYKSKL
jgi:NAD kinase